MLARCLHLVALILMISTTAGCLSTQRADYQSSRPVSVANTSEQGDRLWESVQETLRRHQFRLDRVDRRAGVIITLPATSKHFFEFWRHDVDTWRDLCESTLNPLRRWVEVTVERGDDNAWNRLSVVVHKERLSSPDRQFNSTGAAYQYFGDSLPSTTGLVRVTAEHDAWLDIGRDPALEDHLLRGILQHAGNGSAVERPPVGD